MTALMNPDTIDERFVPRRRPGPGVVPFGDQTVVYDPVVGAIHWLSPSAGLLFQLCDGSGSVGELIDDLADAYGVERDVVAADVLATVAGFGTTSLLEGVRGTATCTDCLAEYELHHEQVARQGHHPVPGADLAADDQPDADGSFLPVPPSPCQELLDQKPWAATTAVAIGDRILGIRSSLPVVDDLVRRALRAYVVEVPDAPANFSLLVHEPAAATRGRREFHRLHETHLTRTRSLGGRPIFECLVDHLAAHLPDEDEGTLPLDAVVLVSPAGAVVLPTTWADYVAVEERVLERRGFRMVWAPRLDPASGAVVAAGHRLTIDPSVLAEVDERFPGPAAAAGPDAASLDRAASPSATTGRTAVHTWMVGDVEVDEDGTVSPHEAVRELVSRIGRRGSDDPQVVLAAALAAAGSARFVAPPLSNITRVELRRHLDGLLATVTAEGSASPIGG